MYCPNCGRSIRPARFCIYCGKRLPEACLAARRAPRPAKSGRRVLLSAAVTAAVVCAAAVLALPGLRPGAKNSAAVRK